MGILTTIKDPQLEQARENLVAEDRVCPECKAPFVTSKATLAAPEPATQLGSIEP